MKQFTKDHYIGSGAIVARERTIQGEYIPHRHEFYELEYILSGSGIYRIDDREYQIASGMLFFTTPFHFHSVSASNCRIYNVMFSEELCDTDFLIRLLYQTTLPALDTNEMEEGFFRTVLSELVNADKSSVYTAYLLNSLLGKLATYQTETPRLGVPIQRAMLYLLHHFRQNPTLAQTAAYVGYAPSYFSAVFKAEVGVGFKEYLDRLRFDYAKKMILHSKMPIVQVCRESGFEDYPNFIRRFKKRFGISPTEMMGTS